MCGGLLTNLP
uniref:Uncharacterized protein n=1 Tax=Moniliophthora roreri TaxID=221103 RepID=A0A0W0FYJ9_MONRR